MRDDKGVGVTPKEQGEDRLPYAKIKIPEVLLHPRGQVAAAFPICMTRYLGV
jgi:hypothetical protein